MEEFTITVTEKAIQEGIQKRFEESLKSTYDNPVNKAVEFALKDKEGLIKTKVNEVIANAINDPDFTKKLGEIALAKMIELALKR